MNELFFIICVALLICLGLLSISGFYGGFHFGCYRLLQKAKKFNDLIVTKGDNEMLREWNEYLIAISVKNNKPSYLEWIKWGWERKE